MIAVLDLAAVLVFAITGALTAARAQLDPVGFVFLACLTAVGGGTVRDLLLDRTIFWLVDPLPVAAAAGAAMLVFFSHHLLASRLAAIVWFDAVALSVAVAAGVGVAHGAGLPIWIQLVMGVVTGCFGGLMRDVVVGELPLVLARGELYVTAALAGGAAAVAAREAVGPGAVPLGSCIALTFALRAGSIRFGWRLPAFRPRPPR
ncbi:putative membrane protein [Jannaschia seosinensis]|uniref:Putative membrane protein n=1 Tax=Jannaschia seosinensis TaxID=313367 RepID=A0A0M7BBN4_9RHOB|nr:TRIC cation channel family protein [Jannaschia seosinensis]CUH39222.1 putative membrane protein [Jannaschia seosinensis]